MILEFPPSYSECKDKTEGLPQTLCNAMVFAEKHPKTAEASVGLMCSALKVAAKHPKLIRTARRFV